MKLLEWMLDRLDAIGWWLFERGKPKSPIPLSDHDRIPMWRVNHPHEPLPYGYVIHNNRAWVPKTATPVANLMLWRDASPENQVEELERVYGLEVRQ